MYVLIDWWIIQSKFYWTICKSSPTASWWLTIVQSLYYFTFHDIVLIKNKKYHKNTILKSDHRRLRNSKINLGWVLVRWYEVIAERDRSDFDSVYSSFKLHIVVKIWPCQYVVKSFDWLSDAGCCVPLKYNFIRLISVLRCIYM